VRTAHTKTPFPMQTEIYDYLRPAFEAGYCGIDRCLSKYCLS
jgi:hypothetical protein